ncbi:uncharacterized protein LOC135848126 [Planococcus citri]|uniref:uncharacterized protein LOC135848126 n=1 Tax=Planococcus citri TaxID=170843 RepID=UPI0031F969D4
MIGNTIDNFVSLVTAMDHLQMNIDTETYKSFVTEELGSSRPFNKDIFKLYNFIRDNAKYEYLFPAVFKHLSDHLEELEDRDELLSIKPDHFTQIITHQNQLEIKGLDETFYPFRMISEICARWICHDLENRSQHALELVNAARYRFSLSNMIAEEEFSLPLSSNIKHMDQNSISRYFCKWLMYFGEIRRSKPVAAETLQDEYHEDEKKYAGFHFDPPYEFSSEPKLKTFLKNNDYYDITVKVGDKMYKLHRPILQSESWYFNELFSKEYSALAAKSDGIPTLPSKDKVYTIDDIDSTTFDLVVDHMYLGNVEPTQEIVLPLFKAAHSLKIYSLRNSCSRWMKENYDQMNVEDVVEVLNFTHENIEYEDLNRFFVSKYIVDSWPKVANLPQFADLFKAIVLPEGADSCENRVYAFDEIDRETFKTIIDYLYFNKEDLQENNIARVFRASDMFKIEKLIKECVKRLLSWPKKMSPAHVKEVLNVTLKNVKYYEVLNTVYLAEHMNQWPQVDID